MQGGHYPSKYHFRVHVTCFLWARPTLSDFLLVQSSTIELKRFDPLSVSVTSVEIQNLTSLPIQMYDSICKIELTRIPYERLNGTCFDYP